MDHFLWTFLLFALSGVTGDVAIWTDAIWTLILMLLLVTVRIQQFIPKISWWNHGLNDIERFFYAIWILIIRRIPAIDKGVPITGRGIPTIERRVVLFLPPKILILISVLILIWGKISLHHIWEMVCIGGPSWVYLWIVVVTLRVTLQPPILVLTALLGIRDIVD